MKKQTERDLRKHFEEMKKRCPTKKPVVLKFFDKVPKSHTQMAEDDKAYTQWGDKQITIWIKRKSCQSCLIEDLYHEYTHARYEPDVLPGRRFHDVHYYIERWNIEREMLWGED